MIYTSAINTALRASNDLFAIVGGDIFPIDAPPAQGLPFVTWDVLSERVETTNSGPASRHPRVEVVGYAATFAGAVELGREIQRAMLANAKGQKTDGGDVEGCKFEGMEVERVDDPLGFAVVVEFVLFVVFE